MNELETLPPIARDESTAVSPSRAVVVVVVVVVVFTLTRIIINSVVAGQALVTLEWNNTLGKNIRP